jgi:glycosyltransferase involved in cell wall biosynthesis
LFVDIGDWARLGEAVARLAATPALRHELAAISRQRVLADFTVEAMCRAYVELYRALGAAV